MLAQGLDAAIKQGFFMADLPNPIQSGEVEPSDSDALFTFGSFFMMPILDAIMDELLE